MLTLGPGSYRSTNLVLDLKMWEKLESNLPVCGGNERCTKLRRQSIYYQDSEGLILCSKRKILGVESRDFSQAEKAITTCKAEQIHKMTLIFTQNNIQGPF